MEPAQLFILFNPCRLDFSNFEIAGPFTCGGTGEPVVCSTTDGPRVGDCLYDTFTVTTPGTPDTYGIIHSYNYRYSRYI